MVVGLYTSLYYDLTQPSNSNPPTLDVSSGHKLEPLVLDVQSTYKDQCLNKTRVLRFGRPMTEAELQKSSFYFT